MTAAAPARQWISRAIVVLTAAALTLVGGAAPADAQSLPPISGSGSTWSFNALNTWIGDVDSNGLTVNFNPVGSSRGRADFRSGTTDFGVTEIPYQGGRDDAGNQDDLPSRGFGYMPIVAGGTAFMYNIQVRGEHYEGLRLSGDTLAKIFTGEITRWNDPQITGDNNGVEMPDKKIIPVVRSDGSGTTAQFTTYLDEQYPDLWRPFFGRSGLTSYYPTASGFVAQNGSDGVQRYISADYGDGAIGYVEYSYALERDWPVAKILNEAGYYTLPTQYNVAVALTRAEIETDDTDPAVYLTQDLTGVFNHTDPRAYPLSSYSYMILPTDKSNGMTDAKGETLSRFAGYFLCEGQNRAGPLGYSPLPLNLVMAGFDQIERIPGNAGDELTDPANCNNPTFDGSDPNRNLLAEIAPAIPDCDKVNEGPCTGETDNGTGGPGGTDGGGDGSGDGTGGTGDGTGGTGDGTGGADGTVGPGGTGTDGTSGVEIDPDTGLPIGTDGDGDGLGGTNLASADAEAIPLTAIVLAAVQLLAILVVPTVAARYLTGRAARRATSTSTGVRT
ncbi:phosphate ABC transporter substrate-binding protein PstS [Glycomyces sp. NPDC047010]|uniref:phosphate ABC transporter substrate-binding protein PstS n=1 Tax=Glycomyces sp. NPDC047010 TaxID=3155023 RepID=UPI00340370A5